MPITTKSLLNVNTARRTISHSLKVLISSLNSNNFKNVFTNRVVNIWNVGKAESLNQFKNKARQALRSTQMLNQFHGGMSCCM